MEPHTDIERLLNAEGRSEFFNLTAHMNWDQEAAMYVPVRFTYGDYYGARVDDVAICAESGHLWRWSEQLGIWCCSRCDYRPW